MVLCLVHCQQLAGHSRVFGIYPLSLIAAYVFDLETFSEIESVVERGPQITYLPVSAEPVYVVATRFQKAYI